MKRAILFLLLISMVFAVFAACGGGDTGSTVTTDGAGVTTDEVTANSLYAELPADLYFEGEEFLFSTYDGGNIGGGWATFFDVDEPEAGNLIQEAAFERNQVVEARLGVTISCEEPWLWDGSSTGAMTMLSYCTDAGISPADTMLVELLSYELFIIDELVADLAAMPYIDLEKPYYNQKFNNTYKLRDNLFFATSDIVFPLQSSSILVVNQNMLVDLGYDENYIYDQVDDGTWVIQDVFDMVEGLWSDTNGSGVSDMGDKFGLAGHPYALTYFYPSCGMQGNIITEDGFAFDYGTDQAITVMNRILDLYENENVNTLDWEMINAFYAGDALFTGYASEIWQLNYVISTFDYGIVPFPKWNEEQESYSNFASSFPYAVPANVENLDMVAAVLELMASESSKSFVPAFYDNYIEQGIIRDERSRANWAKMLNEYAFYDFTYYIKPDERIAIFKPAADAIVSGNRDFKSSWDKIAGRVDEICQDFFDYYLKELV